MSQPRNLADLLGEPPRPYRPHPLLEGALRAWKQPKPRLRRVPSVMANRVWVCTTPDGSTGFGHTPRDAFNDWQRWQRRP